MYNISNIIIQSGVNTLGTDNVTAWATYGKVDGLYWMMINALGISVTTFVGQNYGAGRMDRVHKGAGACMIIGTIMTAIVSTLLYLKGYLLIDLFTSDAQVQEIGLSLIIRYTARCRRCLDAVDHDGDWRLLSACDLDHLFLATVQIHPGSCVLLSFIMDHYFHCLCYLLFLLQQSAARGRKKVVSEKGLLKELLKES